MDTIALAAAADGSLFTLSPDTLYYYDPNAGVKSVASVQCNGAQMSQLLAAVSSGLVYFIDSAANVCQWTTAGGVANLAALPNGANPQSLSAASDGTLWVLGSDSKVYSYANSAWSAVPLPPSRTITMLSVGSSTFAMAACQNIDNPSTLQYQNGTWSTLDSQMAPSFLAACPDGSYWLEAAGGLELVPINDTNVGFAFTNMSGTSYPSLAAASKYACYFIGAGSGGAGIFAAAYGVMNQPAEAWPAQTGTQAAAYNAISTTVGASGSGGIRAQYSNLDAPISEWYTQVNSMTCPSGVTAADWTIVQTQILTELESVTSVDALFANLNELADKVAIIQTDTYNEVVQMVGLPADPTQQPSTIVSTILGMIYDKMTAAAMDAVPKDVSKAINIGISVFKFAADHIAQKYGAANCDVAFELACAKLAGELANIVTSMAQVSGTLQSAILTDWGKLSACGAAISSGTWYWPPQFDYTVLASIGDPTKLSFYQTLMPAKWEIMQIETFDAVPVNAPQYAFLSQCVSDASGNSVCWWWVCAQQGADVSIHSTGPWPAQQLIEAINDAGDITSFFTGTNGWALPTAVMDGYTPPQAGIPWIPWVDSASPLG